MPLLEPEIVGGTRTAITVTVEVIVMPPGKVDRKIQGVIHDGPAVAGKLLAGGRCGRYDQGFVRKLFAEPFEKFFDCFDFAYGNSMHPDTSS